VLTIVPERVGAPVTAGIVVVMGLVAALVPQLLIAPAYSPVSAPANASLPGALQEPVTFANGIEWVGASVVPAEARPGDTATVTIYYRATAPAPLDQAFFLHIVNSANVIVAQRDSLVGRGNPYSLAPGVLYADTYSIRIPRTVPAPDTWQVYAGMYDTGTGVRTSLLGAEAPADGVPLGPISAQPGHDWNFQFAEQVWLSQGLIRTNSVSAGDNLPVELTWTGRTPVPPLRVFLQALGEQDRIWAAAHAELDLTGPMRLNLEFHPDTPPGVYPIEFGVETVNEGDRLEVFDERGVDLGDRLFLGPVRVTTR
jgi:hypothetical protein